MTTIEAPMISNDVIGIIEISLGFSVIILSFVQMVIGNDLGSEWYLRLGAWFAVVISLDLIHKGRGRLSKSSVSSETKAGE